MEGDKDQVIKLTERQANRQTSNVTTIGGLQTVYNLSMWKTYTYTQRNRRT